RLPPPVGRLKAACPHAASCLPFRDRQLAAAPPTLSDARRVRYRQRSRDAEDVMDGIAIADAKSIVAPVNFTQPMAEKPYSYNYEPPPGVPGRNTREETHEVRIIDARALNATLSLDREGFVLLRHPTAAKNLYDEAEIASVYYPECAELIKQATGAVRVHVFDHIVRNAARSAKGNPIKLPAGRVHNDYTAWSAPQRVRDLMGEEAEELLKHRY